MLGEVDLATLDAAELGLANAFWLRWTQLRKEARFMKLIWKYQSAACHALPSCWSLSKVAGKASSWIAVMPALPGMLCSLHSL